MTVLVTDGEQRSALAAVRSLGRAGVRVAVAGHHPCVAGMSRWCGLRIPCPGAHEDRDGFIRIVLRAVEEHDIRLMIPASDASVIALSEARGLLPESCRLPLPQHDSVLRAADRGAVQELARSLQIPWPKTWSPHDPGVTLPAVIKTRRGVFDRSGVWRRPLPIITRTRAELAGTCEQLTAQGLQPLAQEYIPGDGWCLTALCKDGRALVVHAYHRVHEKPPDGGIGVLVESVRADVGFPPRALELLAALDWTGPAMIEFRRDARDGSFKLMEINPRIWSPFQLAMDCGLDIPRMIFELMVLRREPEHPGCRMGVRTRWLIGEFDRLSILLRRGNGARLSAVASFLRPLQGRWETERASDPLPAVQEKIAWAAETWRALSRRAGIRRRDHG